MISSVPRSIIAAFVAALVMTMAPATLRAQPRTTGNVRTAVVNMKEVMNRYQKRTDREKELKDLAGRLQAELQARQQELRTLQNRASSLLPHQGEERRRIQEEFSRKQIEFEVQKQLLEFKHRRQYVTWFGEIKNDIRTAAGEVAREKNFDVVIASTPEEPEAETVQNFDFELGDKLLYYSDAVDITEAVITKLNKAYLTERR